MAGYDCMFLHHLPTGVDDANNGMLHDIFGREKHRADREDNGGTGSYMRLSRTLFVYYGGAAEWGGDRLRELLGKSFGEWGPVEDIHVVPSKCIGFVRYKFRASAEFAKVRVTRLGRWWVWLVVKGKLVFSFVSLFCFHLPRLKTVLKPRWT